MGTTGPLEFEARGNGHSQRQAMRAAELIDDDVVIISPRRFEEVWFLAFGLLNILWNILFS